MSLLLLALVLFCEQPRSVGEGCCWRSWRARVFLSRFLLCDACVCVCVLCVCIASSKKLMRNDALFLVLMLVCNCSRGFLVFSLAKKSKKKEAVAAQTCRYILRAAIFKQYGARFMYCGVTLHEHAVFISICIDFRGSTFQYVPKSLATRSDKLSGSACKALV